MHKTIALLLMATAIAVFTGCEDDSNHSSSDVTLEAGTSTIRGNFTETQVIVANAIASIRVWLKGTTTETYTDQNGSFVFGNIPAGEYTIVFVLNGEEYTYVVSASDSMTTVMRNITVSADGTVVVESVQQYNPGHTNEPIAVDVTGVWDIQGLPDYYNGWEWELRQEGTNVFTSSGYTNSSCTTIIVGDDEYQISPCFYTAVTFISGNVTDTERTITMIWQITRGVRYSSIFTQVYTGTVSADNSQITGPGSPPSWTATKR